MPSTIPTERVARRWVWGLTLLALAGCERDEPAPPPVAGSAPPASASVQRDHLGELPPGPWSGAAAGDELATLRLAADLPAETLLEVAMSDSEHWRVALSALAQTDDAELAFAELASLAGRDEGRRAAALETLRVIAMRRPMPHEPWDPPGVAEGAAILDRISRQPAVPRAQRALAISALRGLARSGRYDAAKIERALDPGSGSDD